MTMSDSPTVSAIIIFLNPTARFLREAVESVFGQTDGDWEILLCDDGSTDDAVAYARELAVQYPGKVKYLEHPGHENRGMSAARNLGLRHARGKYVAWLDADDVWKPEKLAHQLAILEAHPDAAMTYGPLTFWYAWSGRPEDAGRDFVNPQKETTGRLLYPPELLLAFLRDETSIPAGAMVRREVLTEVGGFNEAFRDEYEDVVVHSKVSLRHPVYADASSHYLYRQHTDSCCAVTRRSGRQQSRRLLYLRWLEGHLRESGMTGGEPWRLVQAQLAEFRSVRYAVTECARRVIPVTREAARALFPSRLYTGLRDRWYARLYPNPPKGPS
jgi:glycosyltransferase involved in cell wall biosynthesis